MYYLPTSYWSNQQDRYSQHCIASAQSWSVMAHAWNYQHGWATYRFEVRRHWDAVSTLTLFGWLTSSSLIPKSKISDSPKMANLSRRLDGVGHLAPRLARYVKPESLYMCQPLSDCSLVLDVTSVGSILYCDLAKTTSIF